MFPTQLQQLQPKSRGRSPSGLLEKIAKLDVDKVLDVSRMNPNGTGVTTIKKPTSTRSTRYGSDTLRIFSADLDHYLMAIDMLPGGRQQYANDIQVFKSRLAAGPHSPKAANSPVAGGIVSFPGAPIVTIPRLSPAIPGVPIATIPKQTPTLSGITVAPVATIPRLVTTISPKVLPGKQASPGTTSIKPFPAGGNSIENWVFRLKDDIDDDDDDDVDDDDVDDDDDELF